MFRCTFGEFESSQAGNSMVEFLLVVPVLLMLFLGGIEFSNLFAYKQTLSSTARQLSRATFRGCGPLLLELDDEDSTCYDVLPGYPQCRSGPRTNQLNSCLSGVVSSVEALKDAVNAGISLQTALYWWVENEPDGDILNKCVRRAAANGGATPVPPSRIDEGIIEGDSSGLKQSCKDMQLFMVSEVSGTYQAFIPFVARVLGYQGSRISLIVLH